MNGTFHCKPGSVMLRTGLPSCTTMALWVRSTTKNGEAPNTKSKPAMPITATIKFCFVMTSLLLIRRGGNGLLQSIERKVRNQPIGSFAVDDDFFDSRQDVFHHLDIETL